MIKNSKHKFKNGFLIYRAYMLVSLSLLKKSWWCKDYLTVIIFVFNDLCNFCRKWKTKSVRVGIRLPVSHPADIDINNAIRRFPAYLYKLEMEHVERSSPLKRGNLCNNWVVWPSKTPFLVDVIWNKYEINRAEKLPQRIYSYIQLANIRSTWSAQDTARHRRTQDSTELPQDTTGPPQDTAGHHRTTAGLPQDTRTAYIHDIPQDTAGLPQDIRTYRIHTRPTTGHRRTLQVRVSPVVSCSVLR